MSDMDAVLVVVTFAVLLLGYAIGYRDGQRIGLARGERRATEWLVKKLQEGRQR